jgi:hypothetical protein
MTKTILVLEPDLLFSSSIESAGRKFGIDVKVAATLDELHDLSKEYPFDMLLVNLDALGSRWDSFVGFGGKAGKLIGYYSHVDSKLAKEALARGFEAVFPRRAFAVRLDEIFSDAVSS